MIIEVQKEEDIAFQRYYVIRDEKLFYTKSRHSLNDNELYCQLTVTPSTPGDLGLILSIKNGDGIDTFDECVRGVINMDYVSCVGIKNYILGIGEFHDWWDVPEMQNQKWDRTDDSDNHVTKSWYKRLIEKFLYET